jgi:hypothetical protein
LRVDRVLFIEGGLLEEIVDRTMRVDPVTKPTAGELVLRSRFDAVLVAQRG